MRKMLLRKMQHLLYVSEFFGKIIENNDKKAEGDSGCQRALQMAVLTVIERQCASTIIIELVRR